MNIEAREVMIDAGIRDPGFGRLMFEIWRTYERSQRQSIARGGSPVYQDETRAMRSIARGMVRRSKPF